MGPRGLLFWGLRPNTLIWSAFGFHMDPRWVHMDPKTHWDHMAPFGILIFWTLYRVHLGPYIGSIWDPT